MLLQWITVPLAAPAEACGVGVHSYLVERVLPLLPHRFVQHAAFVRAGAFYPDAFYDCMGQYDVAEDAHWPPFLAAGIDIVKARGTAGEDTSTLEAFLLGILTHQVSDVSWHSLGLFQGLLRAMSEREFDGDYDNAHTVLDVGGDMIQLHRLGNDPEHSKWLNSEWNYNLADIQELQTAAGYPDISTSAIRYCMTRGKAALNAEINVAGVGYKRFARRSPLLFDQLETYLIGGLTDMQQQIEECVPTFLAWLNGSHIHDAWNLCQVFEGKRPGHGHQDLHRRNGDHIASMNGLFEIFRDAKSTFKAKLHHKGEAATLTCDVIPAPLPHPDDGAAGFGSGTSRPDFGAEIALWGSQWAIAAPNEGKVYIFDENFTHVHTIRSPRAAKEQGKFASRFGTSMVVWREHLVVSSPGLSTLDVFDKTGNWTGAITWHGVTVEYGHRGVKLVGQTLTVDKDLGTLYVGAPYYDDMELYKRDQVGDQVGVVYVLDEKLINGALLHQTVELDPAKNIMVKGTSAYARVGSQISLTPRFVLVGSPGEAKVYGFDFATHKRILTIEDSGTDPSALGFGGYLLSGDKDYIVIGAPASSDTSGTQNGRISIYKNTQMQSVAGASEFEWFGSKGFQATVDDQQVIIIASPHAADGRGALWSLDLRTLQLKPMGSPPGPPGSGFGRSIASNDSVAVVGMPFYHSNESRMGAVAVVALPLTT